MITGPIAAAASLEQLADPAGTENNHGGQLPTSQKGEALPDNNRPVRYEIRREAATRTELQALGWSDSDMHERPWPRIVHAYAVDHAEVERPVRHHPRHSPTGFEYGYEGSGPAELARCLLIDYFDVHDKADDRWVNPLPVSYQQFKRQFIARLDHKQLRHTVAASDIDTWAREHSRDRT